MLTLRERAALEFIAGRLRVSGVGASFNDIRAALGISSKSTVSRAVNGLERKRCIERSRHARSISITEFGRCCLNDAHAPTCSCAPCAAKKFAYGQRLVDAMSVQAPRQLHGASLVGIKLAHDLSPAAPETRGDAASGGAAARSAAACSSSNSSVRP